ncbi:DNA-binding transcriptional LysR family regulator [Actinoalloteichus hoggarensis]|uniref:HTH-type transcriptional regulator YofA n=1 Tax=Actinoalloteichus hoggarensis TaxID=1470176 RepID=A0A221W9M1_9PSEU|nr:LysR family transcriptional regulator [Actinoalloteichus hoggarensis]ASO22017.1 HTH-type transcriptional regulator YofA [Actinoalloteichus hoggarensis]MBB5923902.1 DNA-binding transcriptional LysR family regulator [Actinoalloteichus hoggarensis]
METRLLRSFLAVVRTGGITTAAAELSFVQSTVTAHVQSLERLVGVPLFERLPGGTVPTDAGRRLAGHAADLLDREDRMLAEFGPEGHRPAGIVRLHAPESICAYCLPPVLRRLGRRHPDVRLSLVPATTKAALTAVLDRRADLALILEPSVATAGLDVVDLAPQRLSVVAPPDTALPRDRAPTVAELAAAGVLLLEDGCGYSDELAALLAAVDPATSPPRYGSVETVKRCVEAGLGVALLPALTVEAEAEQGRLVELTPPPMADRRLWLVRQTNRWASPAVEAVRTLLVAECGIDETAPS